MSAHQVILSWIVSLLTSLTITPKEPEAKAKMEQARVEVAREMIAVAYDRAESPLYRNVERGRAETAVMLSVIAALETRLAAHVRADQCREGECDSDGQGGHQAVGLMQIHPGTSGITLTAAGYRRCSPRDAGCMHASDLVRNEESAVRLALHMLRQSGLASYCGEPVEGPTSALRRQTARAWLLAHPPPVADADVLQESETALAP